MMHQEAVQPPIAVLKEVHRHETERDRRGLQDRIDLSCAHTRIRCQQALQQGRQIL